MKLVIGLGKTGFSVVNYLIKKGERVKVIDSRVEPPFLKELKEKFPELECHLGSFSAPFLDQAEELIVSPGVSLKEPIIVEQIKKGIKVIGDIELFAREAKGKIAAITGSNGKSTVTTLLGEMAKRAGLKTKVGGNLGTPALDLLEDGTELYVLELSSFQLETTYSLKPEVATILNITPDHLDRYPDFLSYAKVKQRIYQNCQWAIVNREDQETSRGIKNAKIIGFTLQNPDSLDYGFRGNFLCRGSERLIAASELKIKGLHQVANALAALAMGEALQLSREAMLAVLKEFSGLPHRGQWVRELKGVNYYNDSKGTNVGATAAALNGLGASISGKIILLAGGLGKDADFSFLQDPVKKYVRTLILFGKDAAKIAKALPEAKTLLVNSMKDAVVLASQEAKPHDAVLLSPACASFDMFRDYEERGEVFTREVLLLASPF
jgi:UDP-N-acetylmuramoylalanine--D-glutamate ligase